MRAETQHHQFGTLQAVQSILAEIVARREAEERPKLRIGVAVHASHLDYEWHTYGVVIEADDDRCLIQSPGRMPAESVVLIEHNIRVLSDDEWTHVEPRLRKRNERIAQEKQQKLEAG